MKTKSFLSVAMMATALAMTMVSCSIGNGDKEFIFTGKQTLKKGTYLMKGWIYVADGAELTIEPGTVIKGEKTSAASLIVEPGGKIFAMDNISYHYQTECKVTT